MTTNKSVSSLFAVAAIVASFASQSRADKLIHEPIRTNNQSKGPRKALWPLGVTFRVDPCWQENVQKSVPTYTPTAACPESQHGDWSITLIETEHAFIHRTGGAPYLPSPEEEELSTWHQYDQISINDIKFTFSRKYDLPSRLMKWKVTTTAPAPAGRVSLLFTQSSFDLPKNGEFVLPAVFLDFVTGIRIKSREEEIKQMKRGKQFWFESVGNNE